MVTNRSVGTASLGEARGDGLTYWVAKDGPVDRLSSWARVSQEKFRTMLVAAADRFPAKPADLQHEQQHVSILIHGYNVSWKEATRRYAQVHRDLYASAGGLGECVLFTWPSDGKVTNYLPDRRDARASAADLADLLDGFYEWLTRKQAEAADDDADACKAKVSVIAHSMGNYVLQKAAQQVWTRRNQPLLVSLINQLVMVAADVDNDLFGAGESTDKSDGDALANLSYRITALYSGLDEVLGVSAGLKHFGKRRLGRSGLDRRVPAPDNVWDLDCTPFFEDGTKTKSGTHSAYFEHAEVQRAMRAILRGMDRKQVSRRVPKER